LVRSATDQAIQLESERGFHSSGNPYDDSVVKRNHQREGTTSAAERLHAHRVRHAAFRSAQQKQLSAAAHAAFRRLAELGTNHDGKVFVGLVRFEFACLLLVRGSEMIMPMFC